MNAACQFFLLDLILACLLWGCGEQQSMKMQLREAQQCIEQKQTSTAIHLLKMLSIKFPNEPQILELLAMAYFENGQLYRSAQMFEQVFYADTDGNFKEDIMHAARNYEQINALHAAARCYKLYVDYFPKDSVGWVALSKIETQLGRASDALLAFLRSIGCEKRAMDVPKMLHLAQLCLNDHRNEAGLFWYCEALKICPKDAELCLTVLREAYQQNNKTIGRQILNCVENQPNVSDISVLEFLNECRQWCKVENSDAPIKMNCVPKMCILPFLPFTHPSNFRFHAQNILLRKNARNGLCTCQ